MNEQEIAESIVNDIVGKNKETISPEDIVALLEIALQIVKAIIDYLNGGNKISRFFKRNSPAARIFLHFQTNRAFLEKSATVGKYKDQMYDGVDNKVLKNANL